MNCYKKKIHIKTYGCQMNAYDSEKIIFFFNKYSYDYTKNIKNANIIIYNTCNIRKKSTDKIYSELGNIDKKKKNYNIGRLYCAS